MTTDFPTAPLAPGHKGAGGGAVEKSHHRLTHKKPDTPVAASYTSVRMPFETTFYGNS